MLSARRNSAGSRPWSSWVEIMMRISRAICSCYLFQRPIQWKTCEFPSRSQGHRQVFLGWWAVVQATLTPPSKKIGTAYPMILLNKRVYCQTSRGVICRVRFSAHIPPLRRWRSLMYERHSVSNKSVKSLVIASYVVDHTSTVCPKHRLVYWEVDLSSNNFVQPQCKNGCWQF